MSRLDPRNCWLQLSYAIKNQLEHPKPLGGYFACFLLVLYGIRAPIIGPFRAWKPLIPYGIKNQRGASKMRRAGSLWHKRAGASITLDQWEVSLDIPRPMRVDHTATNLCLPQVSDEASPQNHNQGLLSENFQDLRDLFTNMIQFGEEKISLVAGIHCAKPVNILRDSFQIISKRDERTCETKIFV